MDSIVAAWKDEPLEAHTLASTSFSLPEGSPHGHPHPVGIDDYFGGQVTSIHPQHFEIEWIRVYKNPKTTPLAALQRVGTYHRDGTDTSPVIIPPGFPNRRARLLPSLWKDYEPILDGTTPLASVEDTHFWVDIDPRSGGLIDTGENSGLVTATENTKVFPGDIVAIAINVKLHDYKAVREFINPKPGNDPESAAPPPGLPYKQIPPLFGDDELVQPDNRGNTDAEGRRTARWTENFLPLWFDRGVEANPTGTVWARNGNLDIAGGAIVAAVGIDVDSVGILNPNYPLERMQQNGHVNWALADTAVTAAEWGHPNAPGYHTIVYQFTVTEAHVDDLNGLLPGGWLTGDGTVVAPFNVAYKPSIGNNYEYADFNGTPEDIRLSPTVVRRFAHRDHKAIRTYAEITALRELKNDDHQQEFGFAVPFGFNNPNVGRRWGTFMDASAFIAGAPYVPYPDSSEPAKKTQYRDHRQKHSNDDRPVPPPDLVGKYKPGEEVYNIEKSDLDRNDDGLLDYLPVIDDVVEEYVAPIPYPAMGTQAYRDEQTAERNHREADGRVRHYTVSKGFYEQPGTEFPHLFPPTYDTAKGRIYYPTVTLLIDTLQVVADEIEVVEPEGDAYQTGDEIVVRVPFETDGLTFEGDNPPYVTIYLGAQEAANARHATWQKGEEQSGSTIVPFVYTVQEADPSATSVSVDIDSINNLSVPRETTLMTGSGRERAGTADPAVAVGEAPPVSETPSASRTFDVPVKPPQVIYLPPDDTVSKAVASTVPRSPVVFNELGNGSDAANDWLEFRNVTGSDVSLKDWELSVVADGKKEDTSLIVFPDVSVPANGLLLITNMPSDKTPLAGGENKGLSHASLVDAGLSLPDDGKFLLILRNAKEKLGLDEAFIDVAGGGGSDTDAFIRDETGDYDTHVWPLQVLEAPGDATEDALSSGKVWQRAKADLIGYHRDAWAEAAFTGIGYDRKVTQSAATAGTPGYPNGAVKTEASTPKGAVTISEIMFDSEGGTLPQWIELYNKSKTEALNLNRWQLEIQNRNSHDLVGRPIVTLTLQEKVIQPNQTLLIVAGDARASSTDVFPADRVYNLLELHEKNLRIKTARDTFLSGEGFYLKLSDRNGTKIDEVGNIDDNRRTDDAPVWVWPTNRKDGARSSVVRRYDKGAVARDGMLKSNWALAAHFNKFKVESLHYGHAEDIGTPGYRQGGALPVELSSFTLTRTDAGPVVVTWTTESEVDNAGFNLRRSLKRGSGFTLLNPVLIAGAGTTGERQTYTFTDTSAKPGVEYYYQIEEVSLGGRPEVLRTRYLPGPVSPTNRSLTTFGEVKQRE